MTKPQFMGILEETLGSAYTAILATVDSEGRPFMYWMTPAVVDSRMGLLYSVSSKKSRKCTNLRANPNAQWMIQTRTLTLIMSVEGKVNLIENPRLKAEVLEAIGPHLNIFWQVHKDPDDLVVLETLITGGMVYYPLNDERLSVRFEGE